MKFIVYDSEEITFLRNPGEQARKTIERLKSEGKWGEFLENYAAGSDEIDADKLYDYLRYDGDDALLSVGLHENEATASVEDVLKAWEEENATAKVVRDPDGTAHVTIYKLGGPSDSIDFDILDEDGNEDEASLDNDDVLELVGDKAHGNATEGAWDCEDAAKAEFEMWRGRD